MTTTNETIKYNEINTSKITVENVKLGKDEVPLIRYNGKPLIIQGPTIRLSSYGLPPGETLSNGAKNEYYISEEQRDSLKIPLDPESTSVNENSKEIEDFITKLKEIDAHIKSSSTIKSICGIDDEDTEKYNTLYRRPKSNKKKDSIVKEKKPYMKTKLDISYNDKSQILTEFYDMETKKRIITKDNYITLEDLEKELVYNTEITPVVQLVKIWTQSTGAWGVTLKLKKLRLKKPQRSAKINFDFIDDDNISSVVPSHVSSKDEKSKKKVESDSDEPKPVKKIAQVESDSSDSEPEPIKPVKSKVKAKTKVAQIESDGSDSEPEPVKVTKVKSSKK